jgi:pyrroline-5-carboxylate reductase
LLIGTSIETLRTTLNIDDISIIRTMPNVALQVSAGVTAMSNIDRDDDKTFINFHITKTIFAALGVVEVINDEKLFHSIVGLSGSGPAYIFILIEAMSDAGVKQGLTRDMATKFATQTVYGASKMLLETGLHPGKAKDQVASAAGTTIHGIHELEKGAFRNTIINAIEAGAKRSIEMSQK